MHLRKLTVHNVRALSCVDLEPQADLVVLVGNNGSGKTSLLEAIHLLGTGRSFRARTVHDVVARGSDALLVRGEFVNGSGRTSSAAVEKPRRGISRLRVDGVEAKVASELARHLPLATITPDSQRLLSDGAESRRRLLDWLMFHVEPGYHASLSRYRQVLRQRNTMLREGFHDRAERDAWNSSLEVAAHAVEEMRRHRLGQMLVILESVLSELSALPVTLDYHPGWDPEANLRALLLDEWERDAARGFTTLGPHRADLQIKVHGRPAQHVVSRGEGKLLVAAVLTGFARVLGDCVQRRPLLLVDELASELDARNRLRFSRILCGLGMQTFVTAVSRDLVETSGWARVAMYRVDGGEVTRMLQ